MHMPTTMKESIWSGTAGVRMEERSFADVDDSSADSFPASDPPSWASLRVGAPSAAGPTDRLLRGP
jgi:hypothetical protein